MASTKIHVHITIIEHKIEIATTIKPVSNFPAPIPYPILSDKVYTKKNTNDPSKKYPKYFIFITPSHKNII